MSHSPSDPLRPLLQRWLQSDDPDRTLDSLCRDHPEHADALRRRCAPEDRADSAPEAPEQVGAYRVLDTLGEGGMGTVYLAEQREPVQRRVALKLIKLGMDSKAVVRRFEQERQALSLMDHEGIAKVYDAGTSERGQPFFVMELVKGVPLDRFCEQQRLSLNERLKLMQQVCAAVQHAHQKGVLHRDLKPGNVLVSDLEGRLQVKIIDFGLAKALGQKLIQESLFTEFGVVMGTPEYMAPEQADPNNLDVDTRADVYSLGVMLYQLLVGQLPFSGEDLREAGLLGMQRLLREVDPPKPSRKLTQSGPRSTVVAQQLRVTERWLRQTLQGDLDWVVVKALEKDRGRRYQSASAVAEDLQRYLDHEPLLAGPPSPLYRLQKLVRRHRASFIAASLVVVALVGGAVTTFLQWQRAEEQAGENLRLAERNREIAQQMTELASSESAAKAEALAALEARDAAFATERAALAAERERAAELQTVAEFQQDQFASVEPDRMGLRLRDSLRALLRARCVARGMDEADVRAALDAHDQRMAGVDFTGLAMGSLEEGVFAPGLKVLDEAFAEQPQLQARLRQAAATTLRKLGRLERAGAPQRQATDARRRLLGDEHPATLASISSLADLLYLTGDFVEAEELLREALAGMRRVLGDDHPNTISAAGNLGGFLREQQRLGEAEPLLREALERSRRLLGAEDTATLSAMTNLGVLLDQQGKSEEAETLLRDALLKSHRVHGVEDPKTLTTAGCLADVLLSRGDLAGAEPLFRRVLAGSRRTLGDEHPDTVFAMNRLCALLFRRGAVEEAARLGREALDGSRRIQGDEHLETLKLILNLGYILSESGESREATALLREAVAGLRRRLGDRHPITLTAINTLGCALQDGDELAAAELMLREAYEGYCETAGRDRPETLIIHANLAALLEARGDLDQAEQRMREVLAGFRRARGEQHPQTILSVSNLADLLDRRGRPEEAAPLYRQVLADRRAVLGDAHPDTLKTARQRCAVLQRLGREGEAREVLSRFLATTELAAEHANVRALRALLSTLDKK